MSNETAAKVALVTGASKGIGKCIAIELGRAGFDVAVNYNTDLAGAADTVAQIEAFGRKAIAIQADVGNVESLRKLFQASDEAFGDLHVVVANAAVQTWKPLLELSVEEWDKVLNTNLRGAFMCAQQAIRHWLEANKPGSIINISSVHQVIPKPRFLGYSVSKGGMQNLTHTLALEYAGRGIRVNSVGPGATVTPINRAWIDDPEKRAMVEAHIPMGRAGTSDEMAETVAFLSSDLGGYITGQTVFVDGGLTLYPDFRTAWSSE